MGCTTSLPLEHKPNAKLPRIINGQNNTASLTESTDTVSDEELSHQTDYEQRILSSPGQLDIPSFHQGWFPPGHAHIHIRKLFKYHNEIARGNTSVIHSIEYQSKPCALKQIPKDNECSRMIFETEGQVLSQLNHQGIIGLIDIFCDANYYYLAMQKADFDLRYVLNKRITLSEDKARRITQSLLVTIEYMHRKNVAHRDIKPGNITFMASDTNNPMLIDFGDAEMVRNNEIYIELAGTPPYMSPERLEQHKGWQLKKADIWAIGVVAYEMCCGRRCFVGTTQRQVFARILSADWGWPNQQIVTDEFKDFIDKCLTYDAKYRPSATEILTHPWLAMGMNKQKEQSKVEMEPKNEAKMTQ